MLGRTISHYRIVSQLGAGGMGVVYQAEDLRLGRPVALKFLSEDLATDRQAVERLRREARAASALNHPNICTIYDIDEGDGQPFIAMELTKGQTLRDRLHGGGLKIDAVVDLGIQIADALDAAHSSGIIHRDIKPANIFLTERGQVKVLDFGLAKLTPHRHTRIESTTSPDDLTHVGLTLGTIAYMSPEQVSGDDLDGRSDLFSLGDVLYECLTGRQPFTGKSSTAVLAAILNQAPAAPVMFNPAVPQRLQDVIIKCLEKDRELRYQSAADLRADLKRVRRDIDSGHSAVLRGRETPAPAAGAAPPSQGMGLPAMAPADQPEPEDVSPFLSRLLVWITAMAVVAGTGALVYSLWFARPDEAPITAQQPDAAPTAAAAPAPEVAPAAPPPPDGDARLERPLSLAKSSLDARNYRAALAYALEALAIAPDNGAARQVRDAARSELARFDRAIAEARQRTNAGDIAGAARALEAARAIDVTAPVVAELSAQLSERVRQEELKRQKETASLNARATPPRAAQPATAPSAAPPDTATSQPAAPVAPVIPPAKPPETVAPPAKPPETVAPLAKPPETAAPAKPPVTDPPPAPAGAAAGRGAPPPGPTRADDEAAIRRVVASYARAIEAKDMKLFRTIKPNLSGEEERRLQTGFNNVESQQVQATVLNIDLQGTDAVVLLLRRDTISARGRQQTAESRQTLTLSRASGSWVIVSIR